MELLKMHIHEIKGIHDLEISLPLANGVYALTGENGTNKSTIAACAAMVYKTMPKYEYLGETGADACIEYELGTTACRVRKNKDGVWKFENTNNIFTRIYRRDLGLYVFFEGGLYFGSRFQNINFDKIRLGNADGEGRQLIPNDYLRRKFGYILYNDENHFQNILVRNTDGGSAYYYEKDGLIIDDVHMSSGEAILLKTMIAIYKYNSHKPQERQGLMFIDEVEMGLHPSATRRLLKVLNEIASTYHYAIYLITHSITIIHLLPSNHIFYLQKKQENRETYINVINPCFPAQATSLIYEPVGYDFVIFVEDEYAKALTHFIIQKTNIINPKLVYILPIAGWSQVIVRAHELWMEQIVSAPTKCMIILDADVKGEVENFLRNRPDLSYLKIDYLPIKSVEKYLKGKIYEEQKADLIKLLQTSFQFKKTIQALIGDFQKTYKKELKEEEETHRPFDSNGKKFCGELLCNIRNKNEEAIIALLVDYLLANERLAIQQYVSVLSDFFNSN